MATYAVSFIAKAGAEILFSRVASVSLDSTFISLYNKYKIDVPNVDITLEKTLVSAGPNGPWQVIDAEEPMAVLEALKYRHILFQCVTTRKQQPVQQNAFEMLMTKARSKSLPPTKKDGNKKSQLETLVLSYMKNVHV